MKFSIYCDVLDLSVYCETELQLQLASMRERDNVHAIFARNRFKIRRDHILEDAFSQLSALAEEDLRGVVSLSHLSYLRCRIVICSRSMYLLCNVLLAGDKCLFFAW